MSYYYFDTSALVKRYSREAGSAWVRGLSDPLAGHSVLISEITLAEVAAAFAAKHRATPAFTLQNRDEALALFLQHCQSEYSLLAVNRSVIQRAVLLTQNHKLRGYDAVQLTGALLAHATLQLGGAEALTFATADADLLFAAEAEGLAALNPNSFD